MSSRLVVLASFAVLMSACGPELTDPSITLSPTDATLSKRGSTWVFVSPAQSSYGSGSIDTRFVARVKERSGGFLLKRESDPVTYSGALPPKLEVPLEAASVFPVGIEVVLTLEVGAVNWDGVNGHGVALRSQDYRFLMR